MRLLTAGSLVRVQLGEPIVGVYYAEVPPVPIPNTEVKLSCADNTWRVTAWKDRSLPALAAVWLSYCGIHLLLYSSIAQPVEHAAVNRRVVGSSPTWGAMKRLAAT